MSIFETFDVGYIVLASSRFTKAGYNRLILLIEVSVSAMQFCLGIYKHICLASSLDA